ncbi:hypothetical protein GtFV1_gp2 [Gaeumannomyces tritici fusarivirus 1]|uniref:Uncharacterized protein n=1 Tax=Gaeumannomyces tritici fusarivirus 1 TaxID=2501217 RepID=A0A3T0D177_9VIRU|nr:hypothetical protein GtFV1_gp2 [Gaeumannomyces tritici fusarivirus 1]
MATASSSKTGMSLSEAYKVLDKAQKESFKNRKNEVLCEISHSKVVAAHAAIYDALKEAEANSTLQADLQKALDDVKLARQWCEHYKRDLNTAVEAEKAAVLAKEEADKKYSGELKALKESIEHHKKENLDLLKSKNATIIEVAAAEARLKSAAAKFDPEEAKKLTVALEGYKADRVLLDQQLASNQATLRAQNIKLDELSKANAALVHAIEAAKIEKLELQRQASSVRKGIAKAFSEDQVDWPKVKELLGEATMKKLEAWVQVPAHNVRDSISKGIGFFTKASNTFDKAYKGFVVVLKKALEVLKTTGSTYVACIATWVNMILKDAVMIDLKTAKFYRLDLEARLASVKASNPLASVKQKAAIANQASTNEKERSWRDVWAESRSRLRLALDSFNKRAKATAAASGKFIYKQWQKVKGATRRLHNFVFGNSKVEGKRVVPPELDQDIPAERGPFGWFRHSKGKTYKVPSVEAEELEREAAAYSVDSLAPEPDTKPGVIFEAQAS